MRKWFGEFPSLDYVSLMLRGPLVQGSMNGWQHRKKMLMCEGWGGIEEGRPMSEGRGKDFSPPQRFWGPCCSALTKTPRLRPEVVSVRRGVPEHPSCSESDLVILLGQVIFRLKLESQPTPCSSPLLLLIHVRTKYYTFFLMLRNIHSSQHKQTWDVICLCETSQ